MKRLVAITSAIIFALAQSGPAMIEVTGTGYQQIPTAPAAGTSVTSGAANTFTTTPVQLIASTATAIFVTGIHCESAATLASTYYEVQLLTGGSGSEVPVGTFLATPFSTGSTVVTSFHYINPPLAIPTSTRISAKTADSVGSKAVLITLEFIKQSDAVDAGKNEAVSVAQWNGTNVSSPATAGIPDVNIKNFNNVAATSVTTVNANQGTTQPINFTGTGASAFAQADVKDYASNAVTASTSGIPDVNVVRLNNSLTNGNNATLSLAGLSVVAAAGNDAVTFTGGAASGASPAGSGIKTTGGAASTTGGGVAGRGIYALGGAGAASTNGAGSGFRSEGGGTTTVTGGRGIHAVATGSMADLEATTITGTLATVTSVTNGVTVTTNNDKTGYSLAVAPPTAAQNATAVWQDTTAGDFTTASSIGKFFVAGNALSTNIYSIMPTVIWQDLTGGADFTLNGSIGKLLATDIDATLSSRLPTIGYTPPPSVASIATGIWQDTTAGDFTLASSIGKSVLNGVTLGTGLTINGYTGNTPQTGDSYARLGAPSGASIDADILSRMATYTQPTGFLAATFPTGTIANTTNITAGTITTATNLTNLPAIPTNWLTATGIAASALNGKGDWLLSSSYVAPDNADAALAASNTTTLPSMIENVGGNRFNTHALMQSPAGNIDPTPIVNAVWTRDLSLVSPSGQTTQNLLKRAGTTP